MGVEDEAGDFVGLVGDEGFVEKGGRGRSARAIWAATRSVALVAAMPASSSPERGGRGFGEQILEVAEGVGDAVDGVVQRHKSLAGDGLLGADSLVAVYQCERCLRWLD